MSEMDTPFAEPMTMQDALEKANSLMEAKGAESDEPPTEAEPQAEGEEQDVLSEEAEEVDEPESEQEEDAGPQVLTADEYGDVLVKVGDTETTLSDLVKGNLRQSDYSRKTAETSQMRKQMEAEFSEKERALEAREQQLTEQLAQITEQEPNWEQMAEEDPLNVSVEKIRWDKKVAARNAREAEAMAKQEQAVKQFTQETVRKAVEIFPEWTDVDVFNEHAEARKNTAVSVGFTPEEYAQSTDFRIAALLEKARRYDEGQTKSATAQDVMEKKLAKVPRVLKPGAGSSDVDPAEARRAAIKKRFSKEINSTDIRKMIGR